MMVLVFVLMSAVTFLIVMCMVMMFFVLMPASAMIIMIMEERLKAVFQNAVHHNKSSDLIYANM